MKICSIVTILAMTTAASANKKVRPPLWSNELPPTFHTNQDGPLGVESPTWTVDVLNERPAAKDDNAITLVNIITQVGFDIQIEPRPIRWSLTPTPPAIVSASSTPPSGGATPVPAPGGLILLGIAALARKRCR
jgi:hypothetical protein